MIMEKLFSPFWLSDISYVEFFPSFYFIPSSRIFIFFNWSIVDLQVVLISIVQQSESCVHIHISLLFWISFPFRTPQLSSIKLSLILQFFFNPLEVMLLI